MGGKWFQLLYLGLHKTGSVGTLSHTTCDCKNCFACISICHSVHKPPLFSNFMKSVLELFINTWFEWPRRRHLDWLSCCDWLPFSTIYLHKNSSMSFIWNTMVEPTHVSVWHCSQTHHLWCRHVLDVNFRDRQVDVPSTLTRLSALHSTEVSCWYAILSQHFDA